MSHVSPHSRSESERSQNQNAAAIFTAVTFAILFGVLWLANPSMLAWSIRGKGKSGGTENTDATVTDNYDSKSANRVDWEAEIRAVEQQLPDVDPGERRKYLEPVLMLLENETLSEQEQVVAKLLLNQLREEVARLNEQSNQPSEPSAIDDHLESIAQSIRFDDEKARRTAIENAEQRVRAEHSKKEPSTRDIRLSANDNQDRAAALRRQIAQTQQEQKDFQAKAARLAALERDMADVERYLQPFTAPGYLQPRSDRNAWDTERTVEKKPVSFSRLKRLGALDNTMEGLERLYIFGGGKNAVLNNSRPLGSFPQYWAQHLSKPEVRNAVQRAQQLLRDHGQTLVEEQLLSP